MGRMASAPSPISVRKTLSTVAKIGLSMKVWVTARSGSFQSCPVALWSALPVGAGIEMDGAVLRRDLAARNGADQAVDDDAVARLEARLDDPQAAAQLAGRHDLRLHGFVRADCHDQPLRLVGHHGGVRHQI